jgi:predicted HTH transcriptional regulator
MTLSGGDKTIANGDKIAVSGNKKAQSGDKLFISGDKKAQNGDKENVNVHRLLQLIENNANATQKYYAESMGISSRTVSRLFAELQKKGILKRQGSKRKGTWIINE